MNNIRNGTLTDNGAGRWCSGCHQEHGTIYPCKHYPPRVLREIEAQRVAHRRELGRRWQSGDRSTELHLLIAFSGMELPT